MSTHRRRFKALTLTSDLSLSFIHLSPDSKGKRFFGTSIEYFIFLKHLRVSKPSPNHCVISGRLLWTTWLGWQVIPLYMHPTTQFPVFNVRDIIIIKKIKQCIQKLVARAVLVSFSYGSAYNYFQLQYAIRMTVGSGLWSNCFPQKM